MTDWVDTPEPDPDPGPRKDWMGTPPPSPEKADGGDKKQAGKLFSLLSVPDIMKMPDPVWLIPDLLVKASLAGFNGPPKSLKSFLILDAALCLATGTLWRGRELKRHDVLYIGGEGLAGIKKRVEAWMQHHAIKAIPGFRVVPMAVNLLKEDQTQRLIETIRAAKSDGFRPALVIADTLARCSLGCDENSARDVGMVVANATTVRDSLEYGTLVFVHHTGKDEGRGPRGSSALFGAIDTLLQVARNSTVVSIRVEAQKDAEQGQEFTFIAEVVQLQPDAEGTPRTSLVMVPAGQAGGTAGTASTIRMPDAAQIVLRALKIAISKSGELLPASDEYPPNTVAVSQELWRAETYQLKSEDQETNRKTFNRGKDRLLGAHMITVRNDRVSWNYVLCTNSIAVRQISLQRVASQSVKETVEEIVGTVVRGIYNLYGLPQPHVNGAVRAMARGGARWHWQRRRSGRRRYRGGASPQGISGMPGWRLGSGGPSTPSISLRSC